MLYDGIAAERAHVSIAVDNRWGKALSGAASEAAFSQVFQLGEAGAW